MDLPTLPDSQTIDINHTYKMQFLTLIAALFAASVVASPAPKALITRTTSVENGVKVERSELNGEVCCWVGNGVRSQNSLQLCSKILRLTLYFIVLCMQLGGGVRLMEAGGRCLPIRGRTQVKDTRQIVNQKLFEPLPIPLQSSSGSSVNWPCSNVCRID